MTTRDPLYFDHHFSIMRALFGPGFTCTDVKEDRLERRSEAAFITRAGALTIHARHGEDGVARGGAQLFFERHDLAECADIDASSAPRELAAVMASLLREGAREMTALAELLSVRATKILEAEGDELKR
jgi:hypothetical protein